MAIVSTKRDSANILAVDGRLTIGPPAAALRTAIQESVAQGDKGIVLDLANLTYVDSAGLGILAACSAETKAGGAKLMMVNTQPRVREAIELVCLDRVLALHPSVDAALQALSTVPTA